MPRGYWRAIFAVLGLVALLTLLGAGYNQLEQTEKSPYPEREYQPARGSGLPIAVENGKPATKPYQPNCNSPQSRDDADLCAQWAGVQEVEESNRLSRISMRIVGLEIVAIIVTLIFTAWAALAAASAARVAQRSLRLYQEAESALLVPGIVFTAHDVINVTFRNMGRIPAFVAHFDLAIAAPNTVDVPLKLSSVDRPEGFTVEPTGIYDVGELAINSANPNPDLIGAILFKDNVMGWQVSSMCVTLDRANHTYKIAYGYKFTAWMGQAEQLNKEREKRR